MRLGQRIRKVGRVDSDSFKIALTYEDGFRGTVDLSRFFSQKKRKLIAEILRGNMFDKCFLNGGALAWPNGYELCPDALRIMIEDAKRQAVA